MSENGCSPAVWMLSWLSMPAAHMLSELRSSPTGPLANLLLVFHRRLPLVSGAGAGVVLVRCVWSVLVPGWLVWW